MTRANGKLPARQSSGIHKHTDQATTPRDEATGWICCKYYSAIVLCYCAVVLRYYYTTTLLYYDAAILLYQRR